MMRKKLTNLEEKSEHLSKRSEFDRLFAPRGSDFFPDMTSPDLTLRIKRVMAEVENAEKDSDTDKNAG